jgi:hypothetical protein
VPTSAPPTEPLALDGLRGEIVAGLPFASPDDRLTAVRALLSPAADDRTLHRGRNHLYAARLATAAGPLSVVVKAFGREGLWHRTRRRLSNAGKAQRSFLLGRRILARGILTPEPLLWLAPPGLDGPSYLVTRELADVVEARYLIRALNAGDAELRFPELPVSATLTALARAARALHDAGFWHRDFSAGNLLLQTASPGGGDQPAIWLVDLNRSRELQVVSSRRRMADLSRLPLARAEHQAALLAAYHAPQPVAMAAQRLYRRQKQRFEARHRHKNALRTTLARWRGRLLSRGTFAHIRAAEPGTALRERAVWDQLSDQPHLHAGRWQKLGARLADAPAQLSGLAAGIAAWPRVRRRYRELTAAATQPRTFAGLGVALRPWPRDPGALLAAVADLGVRHVLLRTHPWDEGADRDAEVELAAALAASGLELTVALPQNRELVRDPARWRAAVTDLGRRLAPFAHAFQVGQAINRSKWGVWSLREYAALAVPAVDVLRRVAPNARLLGGAVIDFEPLATAAVANYGPAPPFDGLASLLYVDRRGAPENTQLGYDALGKALLVKAIAATGSRSGGGAGSSYLTEVNWPLREGPHSPAGRLVAVDEESQANYLARFYLMVLTAGAADRVFWWQLFAKGYGLADPLVEGSPRRRPAFAALRTLQATLAGTSSVGRLVAPPGAYLLSFAAADGAVWVAGWSTAAAIEVDLPRPAAEVISRDGRPLGPLSGARLLVGPAVRYARLVSSP